MSHELSQNSFEMTLIEHQGVIQALLPDSSHEAFGKALALGACAGVWVTRGPFEQNTSSSARGYLAPPVADQELGLCGVCTFDKAWLGRSDPAGR